MIHGRASRLYELNTKFNVPSVRKPPPIEVATQAVLEEVAADTSQLNGVGTIGVNLSNKGISLPRFVATLYSKYSLLSL
jgi:hypothetical protein